MSTAADPLDFVERALTLRGALSERGGDRLDVILPPEAAAQLELPEAVSLGLDPAAVAGGVGGVGGVVFAGFGSSLLDRLLTAERAEPRLAAAVAVDPGLKPVPELAKAFTLLNGVLEAAPSGSGRSQVGVFAFSWKADCDDVREGLRLVAVAEPDGGAVPGYVDLLGGAEMAPSAAPAIDPVSLARLTERAGSEARFAVRGDLDDFLAAVVRRKARDVERLRAFFGETRAELHARAARAQSPVLAGKVARLDADEASKLAELDERYRVRLTLRPVALLVLDVPVRAATLRVKRRKGERTLSVRWHPVARSWELLVCEGCEAPTRVFAACDERLHVLCRGCYGSEVRVGRSDCPRCCRKGVLRATGRPGVEKVRAVAPERLGEVRATVAPGASSPAVRPPAASSSASRGAEEVPDDQLALPLFTPADRIRQTLGDGNPRSTVEVARSSGLAVEVVRVALRAAVRDRTVVVEGRGRGTRYRLDRGDESGHDSPPTAGRPPAE